MGLKIEARQKMASIGVPVIPGSTALHSEEEAVEAPGRSAIP